MPNDLSRRYFLGLTSSAATASLLITNSSSQTKHTQPQAMLKIGLIGCGGRGNSAVDLAMLADKNVMLWALADAFESPLSSSLQHLSNHGKRIEVPKERQFFGLDAYQKLIESGVDIVFDCSPPIFRPKHLKAAIEAGKHVFAEKPVAVDMAGVQSILATAKIAEQKQLSIQQGFCWRTSKASRIMYGKILNNDFGPVRGFNGTFFTHIPKPLPENAKKPASMGDVEWQLRWWQNFNWLSGGMLVEQTVHTIDTMSWAMGGVYPIAAIGTAGRAQRKDHSDALDHYHIVYQYPKHVYCNIASRQYSRSHGDISDKVLCQNATVHGPYSPRAVDLNGKTIWRHTPDPNAYDDMYQLEHIEQFASIREGKPLNFGESMATSTALALMGREAAHTGKRIKWKNFMQSSEPTQQEAMKLTDSRPIPPLPTPGF